MTPLHQFGELLRDTLSNIPLWLVRVLFIGTLIAVLIWLLRLPRSATTPRGGTTRWDENLKTTASIALLVQILIYSLL
ncbi:hypothetical protein GC176_16150 [bacterium]|nr:hypothetical protein [bacterium]